VVIVAGTGALGTLLAARLGAVTPVTVLGSWPAALAALSGDGATLETKGAVLRSRVRATADPEAAAGATLAFVVVKAPATARVGLALRRALAPAGLAVSLQNGLGNLETLADILGPERVAAGAAEVGATLLGPGRVRAGGGHVIRLANHARIAEAADLLRRSGFDVALEPDARTLLWEKLLVSASLLPVTALLGVPNGEVLRRPSAGALIDRAAREVAAVARAAGLVLPAGDPAAAARRVASATAGNVSSMLQDVRRGVGTEIDALSGAVAREAARRGLDAPVNATLALAVSALAEAEAA
jgi:2-dehydropantoate 2-reductase